MPTPYRAAAAAFASRVTESDLPVLRRLNASQRRDFALDLCALLDFATPGGEPVSVPPPERRGSARRRDDRPRARHDFARGVRTRRPAEPRLAPLGARREKPAGLRGARRGRSIHAPRPRRSCSVGAVRHRRAAAGWSTSSPPPSPRCALRSSPTAPARRWRARPQGGEGRRGRRGKRGGKRRRARRTKTKPSARPRRLARRSRGCRLRRRRWWAPRCLGYPRPSSWSKAGDVAARRARALLRDPRFVRFQRRFRGVKKNWNAETRDAAATRPRVRLRRPFSGGLGGGRRVSERGVSVVGERSNRIEAEDEDEARDECRWRRRSSWRCSRRARRRGGRWTDLGSCSVELVPRRGTRGV